MGKGQNTKKQEVTPSTAVEHKAAKIRHDSITEERTKRIHKSTALEWSAKNTTEGLKQA